MFGFALSDDRFSNDSSSCMDIIKERIREHRVYFYQIKIFPWVKQTHDWILTIVFFGSEQSSCSKLTLYNVKRKKMIKWENVKQGFIFENLIRGLHSGFHFLGSFFCELFIKYVFFVSLGGGEKMNLWPNLKLCKWTSLEFILLLRIPSWPSFVK